MKVKNKKIKINIKIKRKKSCVEGKNCGLTLTEMEKKQKICLRSMQNQNKYNGFTLKNTKAEKKLTKLN